MRPLFTRPEIAALFRVQLWGSVLLGVVFVAFPFYTLYTHGLSVQPIYDGAGNEIGRASYFLISLVAAVFGTALSGVSAFGAMVALRNLASGYQSSHGSGET